MADGSVTDRTDARLCAFQPARTQTDWYVLVRASDHAKEEHKYQAVTKATDALFCRRLTWILAVT